MSPRKQENKSQQYAITVRVDPTDYRDLHLASAVERRSMANFVLFHLTKFARKTVREAPEEEVEHFRAEAERRLAESAPAKVKLRRRT